MKKFIFLILALVLPIGVFVFLKVFGKNEFQVEPLYQHDVIQPPDGCPDNVYSTPYSVPSTIFDSLETSAGNHLTLISFTKTGDDAEITKQLQRVAHEFKGDSLNIVSVWDTVQNAAALRRCTFLLSGDSSMVVVDSERKIRGHYLGTSREDVDRLIVELMIMLKKY